MLASESGAAALLLRAGVAYLLYLLQLQRGALHPAQHHLRQRWQDEPIPLPPGLQHHPCSLLFISLGCPLHLYVTPHPVTPLLPDGTRMLYLKKGKEQRVKGAMGYRTTVWTCQTLDTVYWGRNKALTVLSMYIDHLRSRGWTIGLTLSTSADLLERSCSMRSAQQDYFKAREALLLEDSQQTKPLPLIITQPQRHWLLCPHVERIDLTFPLSSCALDVAGTFSSLSIMWILDKWPLNVSCRNCHLSTCIRIYAVLQGCIWKVNQSYLEVRAA